ncbi:pH-signalling protein PalC [Aspergillus luchuensis]|uniref:pH-signalling protein PalC n=1 Tax=Aspergillus kawachii TaxID=1069201 RepID=A0A146FXM5_ASPKA|nr:pH-signalling protein PalC [Aspergillus luchuensis]
MKWVSMADLLPSAYAWFNGLAGNLPNWRNLHSSRSPASLLGGDCSGLKKSLRPHGNEGEEDEKEKEGEDAGINEKVDKASAVGKDSV